ncbi:saposin-related [Anaeramoeba flamelloides]|uniref:Saposin-related n=1 Tax=Anaeramoeba flamelloides TaxID=1746091 RepID=A0ABQ8XJ39_9EUKA|nr:saposin-related [Anaeramoeba flamelloides]
MKKLLLLLLLLLVLFNLLVFCNTIDNYKISGDECKFCQLLLQNFHTLLPKIPSKITIPKLSEISEVHCSQFNESALHNVCGEFFDHQNLKKILYALNHGINAADLCHHFSECVDPRNPHDPLRCVICEFITLQIASSMENDDSAKGVIASVGKSCVDHLDPEYLNIAIEMLANWGKEIVETINLQSPTQSCYQLNIC